MPFSLSHSEFKAKIESKKESAPICDENKSFFLCVYECRKIPMVEVFCRKNVSFICR